ncbi:MAG: hypothetical protein HYV63_32645 [Candidatus Schekmanbacteria bacterium]|nr:hypothetical protein [Candidatus Schekmanbacteria bacterium]
MPTSAFVMDERALSWLLYAAPTSVLDLGVGFGKWGFYCRLYLDVFPGRVAKADWRVRIDGVEAFPAYLQAHQRHLYDRIFEENIYDVLQRLGPGSYDAIIVGDVLEHFEKTRAWDVLHRCLSCAEKMVLLKIPLGSGWLREGTENELEAHLSEWELDDFAAFEPAYEVRKLATGNDYGALMFLPVTARQSRLARLISARLRGAAVEAAAEYRVLELIAGRNADRLLAVARHLLHSASVAELSRALAEVTRNSAAAADT